jgi:hypothetical protein
MTERIFESALVAEDVPLIPGPTHVWTEKLIVRNLFSKGRRMRGVEVRADLRCHCMSKSEIGEQLYMRRTNVQGLTMTSL